MQNNEPIELEEATLPLPDPEADQRPTLPEPPPVWLVAVEDVRLPTVAGLEAALDRFYGQNLLFDVERTSPRVYRANNRCVRFSIVAKPVQRVDYRALIVEVPDLQRYENLLVEQEIDYERIVGLQPGERALLVYDPAGNLIQVTERREVA